MAQNKETLYGLLPLGFGYFLSKNGHFEEIFRHIWESFLRNGGDVLVPANINWASASAVRPFLKYISAATFIAISSKYLRRFLIFLILHYKGFITNPNPKNPLNILWGISIKALLYSKPKLHEYNNLLPNLPLPSVKNTINQIKKSVNPTILANSGPERLKEFEKACQDFQTNKQVIKAQRLLKLRSWYKDSWLADFWTDYAYLSSRGPLVPNSNYFGAGTLHQKTLLPEARAANVIFWTNFFLDEIMRNNLEPIVAGGVVPTTMHTYRDFSATRVPGVEMDKLVNTIKSRTASIFIKGRVYEIVTYDPESGLPYSVEVLQKQLKKLLEHARGKQQELPTYGLAALTSLERPKWAKIREKFMSKTIQSIESSRFSISFDSAKPKDDAAEHKIACFGGDLGNIWYDKSVNFIVCSNAKLVFNLEHSTAGM